MQEQFAQREREVFRILEKLKKIKKVILIGAYALNAYTDFPRFSMDCDLVAFEEKGIKEILKKEGYKTVEKKEDFIRIERKIGKGKIGIDVLIKKVIDRQSGITFEFSDAFQDSSIKELKAKSDPRQKIKFRTASPEILFVMKLASMRKQDVRDIFILSSYSVDRTKIKKLIKKYFSKELLRKRREGLIEFIGSKDFLSSLQGVYGKLPEEFIIKNKKKLIKLLSST